jgi:hypothetical protein
MKKVKNLTRRKLKKQNVHKIENQIAAVATVNADQVSETFRVRNVATIINPNPIHTSFVSDVTRQMIIEMIGICERMINFWNGTGY